MNIALLAQKGGVGKSTLSLLLYEALRHAGNEVAVHDWDPQGTSSKSLRVTGGEIAQPAKEYDYIIYDTPPSLTHPATATAVRFSNVALVVTTPTVADLWEASDAITFIRRTSPEALTRVVVNKLRQGTVLARLLPESFKQVEVPTLTSSISDRQLYAHFISAGWKALDSKAQKEVLNFALETIGLAKKRTELNSAPLNMAAS